MLISPCVSNGEREIARRAFAEGFRVVALASWPYIPGEKPMTRIDAQIMNRIAQLIAGEDAAKINYKGVVMGGIDEGVARCTAKDES